MALDLFFTSAHYLKEYCRIISGEPVTVFKSRNTLFEALAVA